VRRDWNVLNDEQKKGTMSKGLASAPLFQNSQAHAQMLQRYFSALCVWTVWRRENLCDTDEDVAAPAET
jgi:hypothetical protein